MDKVIVRQNRDFQVSMEARAEGEEELHHVTHIHELTPYTMMLASLGLCTGVVIHTYAHHHNVDVEVAEITLTYHRKEKEGPGAAYEEWIVETLHLEGDLSESQRERLTHVGHQCSIRKMLESGIEVKSRTT